MKSGISGKSIFSESRKGGLGSSVIQQPVAPLKKSMFGMSFGFSMITSKGESPSKGVRQTEDWVEPMFQTEDPAIQKEDPNKE